MKYLGKITDNKDLVTKEYVDIIPYGVCDTASGTVGKTVTLNKTISLTTGTVIYVKFNNANSVANPTLNVNTLGAKSIVRYGTTAPGSDTNTSWLAGSLLSLVYNGTSWALVDWASKENTKNTAGSTDTSSKIFLVGATSQAANPQTYSDNQVYATNGQLDANSVRIAEAVSLVYDSTNKCLNFNFS